METTDTKEKFIEESWGALLKELDQLKEENERLKADLKLVNDSWHIDIEDLHKFKHERDSIKQLNSELVEALEGVIKFYHSNVEKEAANQKAKSLIEKAKDQMK